MRRHALSVLVLLAPLAHAQTTWYVDASGDPPGSGTAEDPYTSIPYALEQSSTQVGDLLLVAPGVYPGNLDVWKGVTIRATAGPLHTRIVPTKPSDVVTLTRNAPPFSRLEGFTIDDPLTDVGVTVYLQGGELAGCLLPENDGGAGIGVEAIVGLVDGCTILNGRLGVAIGGLTENDVEVKNSIVWGNEERDIDFFQGELWLHHCVLGVVGGCCYDSDHNVFADPRFWHPAEGDFHLAPGSPAIDAGDPSDPPDDDGSVRDAGAIPYDPTYAPPPEATAPGSSRRKAVCP